MKKMMCILTGLLLVFTLAACSGANGSGNHTEGSSGNGIGGGDVSGGTSDPAGKPGKGDQEGETATTDKGKKTIVFSTFWQDDKFEEAKKKYEALHPNIEIKLQHIDTDNEHVEADLEKFATTTNTAMLAGKGPDLLEMDKLPIEDYVKRGLLADFNTLMEQDKGFNKADYFTNILDNAGIGGGLYGMPLSFFLMGFAGDVDAIAKAGVQIDDKSWSWEDFAQISKKLVKDGDYPNVIASMPGSILTMMVTDNYATYIDVKKGKASFETAAFTDLMKQVKTMADDGVIGQERPYFFPTQINSPGDYLTTLKGYLAKNMSLYAKPHTKETSPGGYFRSYRTIGLSENSKVKQEAWDFVKFMMSEEIASSPLSAGFPINKKAYANQLEELKKMGSVKGHEDGPLHGASVPVDDAKIEQLTGYVNGAIHQVAYQSSKVEEIIYNESLAFFSGQKTAEAVAKLIQNKVTTYINE
ncbi:ABC transporter substrate-binding protein [Paenibacillus gorillae]|uniref:ABC transporter substrate-binding protein n=1 Tax=Paenibacillus gorillae TaxID=1243662 RepID=UPI0004B47DF2|nr:extracellular solute-binding protein [Paenibacillus gorillae]